MHVVLVSQSAASGPMRCRRTSCRNSFIIPLSNKNLDLILFPFYLSNRTHVTYLGDKPRRKGVVTRLFKSCVLSFTSEKQRVFSDDKVGCRRRIVIDVECMDLHIEAA